MSLCSNTLRAHLRHSRVSRSQTLLPFLYQTSTIQQWHSPSHNSARRYVSYRSAHEDSIPFEDADGNLPPRVEDAPSARKTTMTASERAAFEKLYKTFNTQGEGRSNGSKGEHEELDQIADEYYEDDEEPSGNSLDKVFDAVLQGSLRPQNTQAPTPEPSIKLDSGVADVPIPEMPRARKAREAKAEQDREKKAQLEERERVKVMMKNAISDRELWQILEREVFDPLRKLDLDGTGAANQGRNLKSLRRKARWGASNKNAMDEKMLFANFPLHLLTALVTFRHHFPASQYPLMLLPTIKTLGRSSYALGATTVLYRNLVRTAWLQQSSYTLIDTLLKDMDSNAVEFDAGLLETLDAIIKEHNMARTGKFGTNIKLVYGMGQWLEGIQKIKDWRKAIATKLGIHTEEPRPRLRRRPNFEIFSTPQANSTEQSQLADGADHVVQREVATVAPKIKLDDAVLPEQVHDDALDILDEVMKKEDVITEAGPNVQDEHDVEDDEHENMRKPNKVTL